MVWFIDNAVSLVENIVTAASTDPLSAALVLLGGAIVTLSAGGFGALALGALAESLVPDTATQRQP
ncbi:uncharacterized protein HHUB_1105 [Halobacterium hubeiense]|jgi:hypothetical protein|uniref:Uncharacterized protein n=2 Tax=Halobacterium TaxID=2239 RepID=A0A0U5CUU3_9EURY|nr:hypothetical protein [Halobacterium hubeiense]CQH45087.1 uncharacterized protein HHUB_1105 [Halobacterium hubeiense]